MSLGSEGDKIRVIANPPYAYGNEITGMIIKTLKPDEFVNLMPASKYNKNKVYQYVESAAGLPFGYFKDAATQPCIAKLSKNKNPNIKDRKDFQLLTYDPKLLKFYKGNLEREAPFKFIDMHQIGCSIEEGVEIFYKEIEILDPRIYFMVAIWAAKDGIASNSASKDYRWNVERNMTYKDLKPLMLASSGRIETGVGWCVFNTEEERNNFTNFWYRRKLSSTLLRGLNRSGFPYYDAFPRIDWSRSWTDEEILKEYGFTREEIEEILK